MSEEEALEEEDSHSKEELRDVLYQQHDVSKITQVGIKYIFPILEWNVDAGGRYDIEPRSKILAEISLFETYQSQPKFGIFILLAITLLTYDFLHTITPEIYPVVFIGYATIRGFFSALRSPTMLAAELQGAEDEDGMPADYRAKALSSVDANITLVLFMIAVFIQFLVTSSLVNGEVITRNLLDGVVNPYFTAGGCFTAGGLVYILLIYFKR